MQVRLSEFLAVQEDTFMYMHAYAHIHTYIHIHTHEYIQVRLSEFSAVSEEKNKRDAEFMHLALAV